MATRRKRTNASISAMIPAYLKKTKTGAYKVLVAAKHMLKLNPVTRTYKTKGGFTGLKSMMTRRKSPSKVGKAWGTKRNERYLVDAGGMRVYTSKFATAKKRGEALARQYNKNKFYIQNQVTGSIINFEVS